MREDVRGRGRLTCCKGLGQELMAEDRKYEIRCPVHGFIELDEWERDIIEQPAFQRLRRIRQLGWTDYVYPGATHTRFEHSLGAMHVATRAYDAITSRSAKILKSELGYNEDGLHRDRCLVRLAALLHDVGHGPFSHISEELMPLLPGESDRYRHDQHYSAKIVRSKLRDAIENHKINKTNYNIKADTIAAFLEGSAKATTSSLWRELIVGQMDADRMDYLLRDSLHAGVQYGRFDLERILNTIMVMKVEEPQETTLRIGVLEGGWHAAESLILARYYMFTQVYFHKTRAIYDYHVVEALKELLRGKTFPPPNRLDKYLDWDDWRVLGLLVEGKGGEEGERLRSRNHYREVYHTPEVPNPFDLDHLKRVRKRLGDLLVAELTASQSWYRLEESDIPVQTDNPDKRIVPLSRFSSVVGAMKAIEQVRLYVEPKDVEKARENIKDIGRGGA